MEYKLLKNLSVLCKRTQEIGSKKKIILKISKYPYGPGRPFLVRYSLCLQEIVFQIQNKHCVFTL
jgi:hypothetical protein